MKVRIYFVNQDDTRQINPKIAPLEIFKHGFVAVSPDHLPDELKSEAQNRAVAVTQLRNIYPHFVAIQKEDTFAGDGIQRSSVR